jgi:hypothetical protein
MTKSHYDNPVYWLLPDDGATFKCDECKQQKKHTEVILTQIPVDDSRKVLCYNCVDEWWLSNSTNLGKYPY